MFSSIPSSSIDIEFSEGGVVHGTLNTQLSMSSLSKRDALAVYAPSVYQFIDHIESAFPHPRNGGDSSTFKRDFHEFPSWADFLDTARNRPYELATFTPNEGLLRVESTPGQEVRYDYSGDYLDIGRYLSGEPEAFGSVSAGNPYSIFANIILNLASRWDVSHREIRNRSMRILRLVDWLESRNIRTSVRAIDVSECIYIEMDIKQTQEPLDLNTLAIATNPDFLRRILFRVVEWSKTYESGYGTPGRVSRGTMDTTTLNQNAGGVVIYSENPASAGANIDTGFDFIERELEERLFLGERNMEFSA